jgi:sugar phosphate isomerase/epimerase
MSFMDAVLSGIFTVPGDGCVDFVSLFSELARYRNLREIASNAGLDVI